MPSAESEGEPTVAGGPFKLLRYLDAIAPVVSHALLTLRARRQARASAEDRRYPPDGYRRVSPPIPAPTPHAPHAPRPRIYSEPLDDLYDAPVVAAAAANARARAGYAGTASAPGPG